jgi:hypothetical protein
MITLLKFGDSLPNYVECTGAFDKTYLASLHAFDINPVLHTVPSKRPILTLEEVPFLVRIPLSYPLNLAIRYT